MSETALKPNNPVRCRTPLGNILVKHAVLTEEQLEAAVQYQVEAGCRLGDALLELGFCSDQDLARALAEQIEAPYVDLHETPPMPSLVTAVPRELAMEYGVLPVRMEGDRLIVAALNPADIRVDEAIRQWTGLQIRVAVAPEHQLREQLRQRYGLASFEESRPALRGAPADLELDEGATFESIAAAGEHINASQIITTLIADAVRKGASDIHFEPQEHQIRVRYRLDGEMTSIVTLPRKLLQSLAVRTKVVCGMDLSESRKPQDGGCRVKVDGRLIEVRGSTLPGVNGEIVVFRILTRDSTLQKVDALGFEPDMLAAFRRVIADSHGMVLVTGPTGSGKTTTLYAALAERNTDAVNVVTVEDPVEVRLLGVNQVQVDERAGRTFAGTLRGMLRQDPDIIMVGEVRDLETAEIACRAALTGHLVLSTLHARHALGTVVRLVEMGVARYTIAASLNAVLAQRLVRRVCPGCAADHRPAPGLREFLEGRFGSLKGVRFQRGKGCAACRQTGTRGRVGVYELLVLDEKLRRMLAEGASRTEIKRHADERGFHTMEQDAFQKACRGLIAPEELLKLSCWAEDDED